MDCTAFQVPPSMGFSRQEYWSGVPLTSLLGHLTRHYYPLTNSSLYSPFPSVLFLCLFTVYLLAIIPSTVPHPLKLWNQSVSALEVRAFIAHLFGCFQCLQISLSMSTCMKNQGLPWWLSGKESSCHAEDAGGVGSIPGSGRSPGGGQGRPLQYSCLENLVDRGAYQSMAHRITKSWTQLRRLRTAHTHTHEEANSLYV